MPSPHRIDTLKAHAPIWERIQPVLIKNLIPHAFLFIGPRHAMIAQFVNRLMARLLCQNVSPPCGECRACHLLRQDIHPDIMRIVPETATGSIKIEPIRALSHWLYQTPKIGTKRFIVIKPADRLNTAAANALLKMLEEPPMHAIFILVAEQLHCLPATIISRCQQYTFPAPQNSEMSQRLSYLMIGHFYTEASGRADIFKQRQALMDSMQALIEEKMTPCAIVKEWSDYEFVDVLWFLYLLTAEIIRYHLFDKLGCVDSSVFCRSDTISWEESKIAHLACKLEPPHLFRQLDQINLFLRKVQQNITLNSTLALEILLLGYLESNNVS